MTVSCNVPGQTTASRRHSAIKRGVEHSLNATVQARPLTAIIENDIFATSDNRRVPSRKHDSVLL